MGAPFSAMCPTPPVAPLDDFQSLTPPVIELYLPPSPVVAPVASPSPPPLSQAPSPPFATPVVDPPVVVAPLAPYVEIKDDVIVVSDVKEDVGALRPPNDVPPITAEQVAVTLTYASSLSTSQLVTVATERLNLDGDLVRIVVDSVWGAVASPSSALRHIHTARQFGADTS